MFNIVKKTISIIVIIFSQISNSFAEDISLTIIEKLSQEGFKTCKKMGLGGHLFTDNLIKILDISNDLIEDIVIDTSKQRCKESSSIFAGGTGGNNFIFFINPTMKTINSWTSSKIDENETKGIFKIFIRSYDIINWEGKSALKIQLHGVECGVDGATGCYSIVSVSENGFKILQNPLPNPSYSLN